MTKNSPNPVPCGKCTPCRKRRASGWSFRLIQQEKISSNSIFLTLTYDNTKLTFTDKGFMALNRRDVQLFIKRLRKHPRQIRTGFPPIRYYCAGEYGGQTDRPHYHLILFNANPAIISEVWGCGQVHIGQLSEASVGYTLKYISKQSQIPKHKNDDRPKEFSLMSKGLGKNYLTREMDDWHKADLENRMYVNIPGGKKAAMPRYYKDKLYTPTQREKITFAYFQKKIAQSWEIYVHSSGNPAQELKIALIHDLWLRNQPTKDNL